MGTTDRPADPRGDRTADAAPSAAFPPLSGAELDDLLRELLQRVDGVVADQRRLQLLLDAVVGIAADLSLDSLLARIVQVASELAGAGPPPPRPPAGAASRSRCSIKLSMESGGKAADGAASALCGPHAGRPVGPIVPLSCRDSASATQTGI